jgi:hypothetical protein
VVAPRSGPQLPPELSAEFNDDGEAVDRSIYLTGKGDTRGYYADGAYTAAPDEESDDEFMAGGLNDEDDAVSQAFYESLEVHFTTLRDQLRHEPDEEAILALPPDNTAYVPAFGKNSSAYRLWNFRLRETDPLPVQVAALDKLGILRIIRVLLEGKLMKHGYPIKERTSRWVWSLLARLPDRGEMDSTEIAVIRDLGKRAVLMMTSKSHATAIENLADQDQDDGGVWAEEGLAEEEMDEDGVRSNGLDTEIKDENDSNGKDLPMEPGEVPDENAAQDQGIEMESVRARLLGALAETAPSEGKTEEGSGASPEGDEDRVQQNFRATLNMILSVAGEFYGQRDLLTFRNAFANM